VVFAEGEDLLNDWSADSTRRAIDKFLESSKLFQAIGDLDQAAVGLRRAGNAHQSLGEYQKALELYQQSLTLSRTSGNEVAQAESLNASGYVFLSFGKKNIALDYCSRALKLSRKAGERRSEARALDNLGEIYNWSGALPESMKYYSSALEIWKSLADRRGEAETITYLGYTFSDLGHTQSARKFFQQSLALWQSIGDMRGQATSLTALGRLDSRTGENQTAIDYFERAMELIRPLGDPFNEASIFNGLAYVYDQLGEKQKAIEYYEKALSRFRAIGFSNAEAMTLYDAARAQASLGNQDRALLGFQEAFSISRQSGDRRLQAVELREIGKIYDAAGKKTEALDNYMKALSQWSDNDFRAMADTLAPVGRIFEEKAEWAKALSYYGKALALSRKADYRAGEAGILQDLARLERNRGNLDLARDRIEAAIQVMESLREKIDSPDLRTSYFVSINQQYGFYIDLLMKLHARQPQSGFDAAAFEASERARARSLLETISIARVRLDGGVDSALAQQQDELSRKLDDLATRQMTAPNSTDQSIPADSLAREIDETSWQLRQVNARVFAHAQRQLSSLTQPLGLREIQQNILDQDSVLLEYVLGDERSYVWVVTRNELSSYELPPRAQIEEAARSFYSLLTAYQRTANESFEQTQTRIKNAEQQIDDAAAALGRLLLAPVGEKLGKRRLLIVADGALQFIPFQALTLAGEKRVVAGEERSSASLNASAEPLIVDHEIVNEPSASALAVVLNETKSRAAAPKTVAIFANPVFDEDDPRVQSPNSKSGPATGGQVREVLRDLGVGDGLHVPALPASRDEAEAIMSVVPSRSVFAAMGFDATRASVTGTDLSQFRIVHFATHSFVDYDHPELSGLLLSLVDKQGKAQEGFLRMHDIYNLRLPVDLVVLSACNTGLGREVKGEGLIGLTRGFMYAGAKGVTASLWKVDDEATAELMKRFYEGMLSRGLAPASALREAQLAMRRQARWHAPYYWAAFVLQGQYNQNEFVPRKHNWIEFGLSAAVVVVCLAAFLYFRIRRRAVLRLQ
jgi:CHAT domain-containing protein